MNQFVDRRLSGKNRSAVNRQRFLRRFKGQIRKAVADAVSGRDVADLERGEKISIPAKDLGEPVFQHGSGGQRTIIHPGNKEFVTGDRVKRPEGGAGQGSGSGASQEGEGLDEFVFELTKEEFMNYFFEDLALPDLVKKQLSAVPDVKRVRAGFTSDGTPSSLHVVRSMKQAPVIGSGVMCMRVASAMNFGSFMVSSNALRSAFTRYCGTLGGNM